MAEISHINLSQQANPLPLPLPLPSPFPSLPFTYPLTPTDAQYSKQTPVLKPLLTFISVVEHITVTMMGVEDIVETNPPFAPTLLSPQVFTQTSKLNPQSSTLKAQTQTHPPPLFPLNSPNHKPTLKTRHTIHHLTNPIKPNAFLKRVQQGNKKDFRWVWHISVI